MLELLAEEDLPWSQLHLFQVDERVVPPSDPARNLAWLRTTLLERVAVRQDQIHPMPVDGTDLDAAAREYATTLREVAGAPPMLDLVQLGLGADGHTASLVAGDPALDSRENVAVTGPYEGARRMTLTFPIIGRARMILWVVTGSGKRDALSRLLRGDESIPAAQVPTDRAILIADDAAIVSTER
jgi:6-phosphogluconolactonase